jgi:ABC-type glycerol-3-phosphate transport system substrate-binding protein
MTPIRRIAAMAAIAAALVLAACGGNPAAPQGNYGTIMGVVKSSSGQPIAGAKVTVDSVLSAMTDADGKYKIQTVPVDSSTTTTTVTCHADGYQDPPPQHVTVTAGKQFEVDFSLSH